MQKLIRNNWCREPGAPYARARILNHQSHPEGLDVDRLRFLEQGNLIPDQRVGHIISIYQGNARLWLRGPKEALYQLGAGCHLYLPPGLEMILMVERGTELMRVSGGTAQQARGKQLLLRDEAFLTACATENHPLRWTFTPQYLSRRIFLHHDKTLLSKSGNPVSWFRTTMFDVTGLPENEEGEPVFKMSYNSRTEFNICYDVKGDARVRMALHPYRESRQAWGPWHVLDSDSTYHLNEFSGSVEEECFVDHDTNEPRYFRNKHEVFIANGYVTLFCLFDPAPTGIERHLPGQYSDYEPFSRVTGTKLYEYHRREIAKFDEMTDRLSAAKATGTLSSQEGTAAWELYLKGRAAQAGIERDIVQRLQSTGSGREAVLAAWMQHGVELPARFAPRGAAEAADSPVSAS